MRYAGEHMENPMSRPRLALYNSASCWFCARVRQTIDKLGIEVEIRDVGESRHRADLLAGGGKTQVPCLRIETPAGEVRWMYESADISRYLEELAAA